MRKNNIFKKQKKRNSFLKYFIIAFALFLVILAGFSAFTFMRSLDFDIDNLVNKSTSDSSLTETEPMTNLYSVESLNGKSTVLFICVDLYNNLDFAFTVSTDYDGKTMGVKCVDKSVVAEYNGVQSDYGKIYSSDSVDGLKKAFSENLEIQAEKYVLCSEAQFKEILSLFDGISVNVLDNVDYRSADFNLELDLGYQTLSDDYVFKYMLISDNTVRESIICDIINSVLLPEYTENSGELFKAFVNSCKTDISIIDYSEEIEKLLVYSKADDKFLPEIYK
ncbi:MAG: hypothetical protein J1F23_01930 [Oscillospiraceae bacterium]|nr:hypothetical protein [Oscillospiraceae bacterium]